MVLLWGGMTDMGGGPSCMRAVGDQDSRDGNMWELDILWWCKKRTNIYITHLWSIQKANQVILLCRKLAGVPEVALVVSEGAVGGWQKMMHEICQLHDVQNSWTSSLMLTFSQFKGQNDYFIESWRWAGDDSGGFYWAREGIWGPAKDNAWESNTTQER